MLMINLPKIGKILRLIRLECNETQKEMAAKLNISGAYLSAIELGKRPLKSQLLNKLCTIYPIALEYEKELRKAMMEPNILNDRLNNINNDIIVDLIHIIDNGIEECDRLVLERMIDKYKMKSIYNKGKQLEPIPPDIITDDFRLKFTIREE